ncbi:hypothetical protein KVR01_010120 [Diaporthe batatas]|uniref:uncharacterized protein n=1 Tax=Diaporthe batatas TaxID=748121 RepID=UPI001D040E82|nr:uncharacterized protein KVR01_010120 [Diaporthe batatas]KAG8160584.1 hypothetical protein KVR01_010120 [Diaporthe batatas]
MSGTTDPTETSKKGQLNDKQTKLLAAMAQNTIGKVEYNWEKIAMDSGYKNVASAKSTYSRLCSQLNGGGGSKTSGEKGDGPVGGGPKTPTKINKRSGKVGSSSTKKPRAKKAAAATSLAINSGNDDEENGDQIKLKMEPEDQDEDEVDTLMSGAL